jgi:short-subunit dehydrogenase
VADVKLPLRDAVAVITGAGSGIGRATALAARGSHLALTDRDADGLTGTVAAAEVHGVRVTSHLLDVTDVRGVANLPAAVVDAHGRVTVLVNNAGVALTGAFVNTSLDEFRWLTATNLDAVVAHTHAFLPELLRQPAAQIVMVSSLFGLIAPAGQVAYATAKFGVRGFGEALRHELAGTGTGVTVVHPGGIATAIARNARTARDADQHVARTVSADFEQRHLRIPPRVAGERIVRAVERRRPRLLIGADARIGDLMQRLAPARYWRVLGRGAPPAP